MKKLRKLLFYLLVTAIVVVVAIISSVFLFKDKIIRQFVAEANKHLATPVKIGKIDISTLSDFPNLSLVLTDVYIEDSHPGTYPLLTAKTISFQLNPIRVWQNDYTINGLRIDNAEATLKVNDQRENNFTIVSESQNNAGGTLKFELQNVALNNVSVRYVDLPAKQDHLFTSEHLQASIQSLKNVYDITATGNLTTNRIEVSRNQYFTGKSFNVATNLRYDDEKKIVTIQPSELKLGKAAFTVKGTYAWKEKNLIDLTTDGKETDIQTLLSLLPETLTKAVEKYRSDGQVYFHSTLKGEISKFRQPFLNVEFGFTDATIFHPDYNTTIEHAAMTGSFASADFNDPRQSTLVLKNITGSLNNEKFEANFVMNNFANPEVILNFKGRMDAASIVGFYPVEEIKNISGSLVADLSFEGKIELLKNKATAQRVSTLGTIDLQHINFSYGKNEVLVENLNGSLQFNNNDLALSNVSGMIGKSDFLLNGFFKNAITFLLFENQPVGIETDLRSAHIDLEELLNIVFASDSTSHDSFAFAISPNIYLNFNCDVKSLSYKKFNARQLRGDLLVKNQVAVSRKLEFNSMGGAINLSGIVDAKNHKAIDVVSTVNLDHVNIDSAFLVFENFQQQFIEHRHLRGNANAEVNLEMTLNEQLRLFPETLIADIGIMITDGELNNFEPLKKLNRYVDDETLNRLRFANIRNDIHIEKKTVFIPEMEIRSNATELRLSGTHTFDQKIDYRIVTPLRRKKIVDVNAEAATEKGMDGQTKLFLKITGTTDEYDVAYDTKAVRNKIANDFKKEVQELKDAFRSKGKRKEKEIEVSKDDYFDF